MPRISCPYFEHTHNITTWEALEVELEACRRRLFESARINRPPSLDELAIYEGSATPEVPWRNPCGP